MAGFRDFQTGEVLTAANVNDFLSKQAVMKFADASARDTALGTAVGGSNALREGMVAYLDDTDDLQVYNGTAWTGAGYRYAGTRYYTSSGTFAKADPLGTGDIGLRAIRVRMVGGGGAGGGDTFVSDALGGAGGGGGGYAEKFITDIASLSASETVTRGSGGTGTAGAGGSGGTSSFDTVSASGGGGAPAAANAIGDSAENQGGVGSGGDLNIRGQAGGLGSRANEAVPYGGPGGSSQLGGGGAGNGPRASSRNGQAGGLYGGGGGGGITISGNPTGGDGANGIVIIDCFV